ncbi:MAG TPA: efflux RND transporter periplasmic adaptor subunit [Gammaproteobacteria bacterium]|nr:efflux RND transporter periplasmic adaptor subunit [Gammaproteobacteria bacterium]
MRYFLLFGLLSLAGCGPEAPPEPAPRPAITQRIAPAQAVQESRYTGEIHARYETPLSFRVGGKVQERLVGLGDTVEAGQLLAKLDPHDVRLAKEAASADFQAAKNRHTLAKSQFERAAKLLERGLISQSAFDQRKAEFDVAAAQLKQARKQLQLRQNQLAYTELRADHVGIVTRVMVEPGQVVAAGQPVFTFARTGERELWIAIPENRIDTVLPGEAVTVSFWALPQLQVAGKVREIAASADPATRTYRVHITLLEPPPAVRLGMSATAHFQQTGAVENTVITLPLTSLHQSNGKAAVWVVNEKTHAVALQAVDVLRYRDDAVVIATSSKNGLQAGDQVVVKGVHKLHAGQIIDPLPLESYRADGVAD